MGTSLRPRSSVRRRALVVVAALVASCVGAVGHASAAPVRTSDVSAAAVLPSNASRYVPVTPVRMARTWVENSTPGFGFDPVSTYVTKVRMRNSVKFDVPDNAVAVVVNITVKQAVGVGSVAVYASDATQPAGWNVYADKVGRTIANLAHVQVGADGYIKVYRSVANMNVAIDLVGYYELTASAVSAGRLVTLAGGGSRSIDTRDTTSPLAAGATRTVDVGLTKLGAPNGVPTSALAVVVTVTAIYGASGFWTAYPNNLGTLPGVSSLNLDGPNQVRAAQAIVPLDGTTTNIKVYSSSGGHLAVDVVGYFTGASASSDTVGLFVPKNAPFRMLKTSSMQSLPPWATSTFEKGVDSTVVSGAPANIGAVAVSLTASDPWANGFLTAYPAGQPLPGTSNLNIDALFQTRSVAAISPVSTRGLAVYTASGSHMNVDLMGWYLGTPTSAPNPKPTLPSYSPTRVTQVTSNRFIGGSGYTRITNPSIPVVTATANTGVNSLIGIADRGLAGVANGSQYLAQSGNMIIFAHRTSHGGPWRWMHQHQLNDTFYLMGADGKKYNYRVVDIRVTAPTWTAIAAAASGKGPITVQLVACSRPDKLPTSTSYRLVVTGRLYSIT